MACVVCGWIPCDAGCCGPHDELDHPAVYPDIHGSDYKSAARLASIARANGTLKELTIAQGWCDADDWYGYPREKYLSWE